MKFKHVSRVTSITMLLLTVGSVSYPLGSKVSSYVAAEIEENTPQVIYTKDDLLTNKNGSYYEGNISNANNDTLEYSITFDEFTDSEALVRVNNKTINLNAEDFSGKTFEGETTSSIEYTIDASNINKDIVEDLTITQLPSTEVDTGDVAVDENGDIIEDTTGEDVVTPDTGDVAVDENGDIIEDITGEDVVTPDTGDVAVDEDGNIIDGTQGVDTYNTAPDSPTYDGGEIDKSTQESSLGDGGKSSTTTPALIANDVTLVGRDTGFDTSSATNHAWCYWNYTGTGTPSKPDGWYEDCSSPGSNYTLSNDHYFETIAPAIDGSSVTNSIKTAPAASLGEMNGATPAGSVWVDYMNIQARNSDGTYINPSNITIEVGGGYRADRNSNWTGVVSGDNTVNSTDSKTDTSDDILSPFYDATGKYVGYAQYPVTVTVTGTSGASKNKTETVKSTVTVVDPFFDADAFASTSICSGSYADTGTCNYSPINDHFFGNIWSQYSDLVEGSLRNASLDMNLDVDYVYHDPVYDASLDEWEYQDSYNGLTSEGANAYLPSKNNASSFNLDTNPPTVSRGNNNIPGYELYVPMDSDEDSDASALISRYFDNFVVTTGTAPDIESTITNSYPNTGYLGMQVDVSSDINEATNSGSNGAYNVVCDSNVEHDGDYSNHCSGDPHVTPSSGHSYHKEGDYRGYDTNTYGVDGSTDTTFNSGKLFNVGVQDGDYQGSWDVGDIATGLYLVDDGGYDNTVANTYNMILGYRMPTTLCAANGANNNSYCDSLQSGIQALLPNMTGTDSDQSSTDIYMILTVVVDAAPVIAADDTEIWQHAAPSNTEELKDVMDVEALGLKAMHYEDAKQYDEENICEIDPNGNFNGGDASDIEDGIGNIGSEIGVEQCGSDADTWDDHYVANYIDQISVRNWQDYDYNYPEVGSYLFTFYYDFDGTPGLSEQDPQRDAILYVKDNNEDIYNADLQGTTPIAVKRDKNNGSSYDSTYDAYVEINPAMIKYVNDEFEYADQGENEITVDMIDIIEGGSGEYTYGENISTLWVIQVAYRNLQTQMIVEVQWTSTGEPWDISNQVSLDAIDHLVVPQYDEFDPLTTTNPYCIDAWEDECEVAVDVTGVTPNVVTGAPQEVGLVGYQYIQGQYYAQTYKVVEVEVYEVDDNMRVKIVSNDAKSRENFTAKNEDDLKEMMKVQALGAYDEDITDLVEVFGTGGFDYGDSQTVGEPYTITFGVTDPETDITYTTTSDYSVIENQEYLPEVTLKGTQPIYVKTGDDVDEEALLDIINAQVELSRNYEFYGLDDSEAEIIATDGYDPEVNGNYEVAVRAVYDEEKSAIDPMKAEAIFEVVVDPNVETTQAPIKIVGADDVELAVGSTFDPLEGVTATSSKDGDVTDEIEVLGNSVDLTEDGDYAVTYYVEDSTGAYAEVERQVRVGAGDPESETDTDDEDDTDSSSKDKDEDSNDSSNKLTPVSDSDETLTNTASTNSLFIVLTIVLVASYAIINKKFIK